MSNVVGLRFHRAGRVYYYDPAAMDDLQVNEYVVAETERGLEIGWVVIAPKQVVFQEVSEPPKPVLRRVTPEDLARQEEHKQKAKETLAKARVLVQRHGLPMKLLSADYTLDGSKVVIQFGAEERVDFRQLLRDLGATFRMRVELRQVGPRDCTKLLGGIGKCGLLLCCTSWLSEFNPVTIKMAKEQDLPINIPNLSGACGRLRCCLRYEYESYRAIKAQFPRLGEAVITPRGSGSVVYGYLLRETLLVRLENDEMAEFPLAQVTPRQPCGQPWGAGRGEEGKDTAGD